MCVENETVLRTEKSYEEDVKENNMKNTGIKEPCAFYKIRDFHITRNIAVDFMHDVLEGVCAYDLRSILYSFVFEKKYFTLEYVNGCIQSFDYGPNDNSNKPPVLKLHAFKNKLNLKCSVSEMLCLVRYFGLLFGDKVPFDDECWQLYKYLRQIIDILTSPRIIRSDAKRLEDLIKLHNELYVKLFGKLKPKFHNLIHYPSIMLKNGPVIHFWVMRFESRHREVKANAQATSCNKNMLVIIATKQMLKMCEIIHFLQCESDIKCGVRNASECETKSYFTKADDAEYHNQAQMNGIIYKIGMFLVINMEQSEIEFGKI